MKRLSIFGVLILLVLSACAQPLNDPTNGTAEELISPEPILSPTDTVTVELPAVLTVCTSELPESLFLYDGTSSIVKTNILAMIQGAPLARVEGDWVARYLEKVPARSDGDLRLETVAVQEGQMVVDARGQVVVLKPGVAVRPSGCHQSDCALTWDGETSLELDRMVIEYTIDENLTWSDGSPVTAADSVFSYSLANASQTPGVHWAESRTDTFKALDQKTVQWVGRPGYTTAQLDRFFWLPLPSHLIAATLTWDEAVIDEALTTSPLSYGPLVLSVWEPGIMRFEPNTHYFKKSEIPELLEAVVFRVVDEGLSEAWGLMRSGECNLLDASLGLENDPDLVETIKAEEGYFLQVAAEDAWTQLVFNIQPADENILENPEGLQKVNFFGDGRVRQAFAACLDREAVVENALNSLGETWHSFMPPGQSGLGQDSLILDDPEGGLALLEQAGWIDHDGDLGTPLQALGAANVPNGTALSVELLVGPSGLHHALAEIIRESLGECGVDVVVTLLPVADLYAPGPDGPLFGRKFDLALVSWQALPEPDCGYYQSWGIPTAENQWIGTNLSGLAEAAYDNACVDAALAIPEDSAASLNEAESAFIEYLPALPLVARPTVQVFDWLSCGREGLNPDGDFLDLLFTYPGGRECP